MIYIAHPYYIGVTGWDGGKPQKWWAKTCEEVRLLNELIQ